MDGSKSGNRLRLEEALLLLFVVGDENERRKAGSASSMSLQNGSPRRSVTRLGDLLDFGQAFKAIGSN